VTGGDDALRHVPEGPVPSAAQGERLLDLVRVMARLRAPGGCPWDAEQTHSSLAKHLLEETHEVLDAIDSRDPESLRDELGDLLLQVVFHAELAREAGEYDVDGVAEGVVRKLIRRHPHVFGDVEVASADEVLVNWEKIKADERTRARSAGSGPEGEGGAVDAPAIDDEIPATLPALARASKVQRRAAGWGFEWRSVDGAMAKLREEIEELSEAPQEEAEAELGDVLFAAVAVARQLRVDPESALRRTTRRFADRYAAMLERAQREGADLGSMGEDELLAYWRASR
jgi:tetrapyrrole methylase family protein/MazG family protein